MTKRRKVDEPEDVIFARTDLRGIDPSGVYVSGAALRGAFRGAVLSARFDRVVLGSCTVIQRRYNFLGIKWTRVRALEPSTPSATPPCLGTLLICLFVPLDRQKERLGDFEEQFTTLWLPRFGPRVARLVYMAHAARSVAAMVRIALTAAVMDRVLRAIGW